MCPDSYELEPSIRKVVRAIAAGGPPGRRNKPHRTADLASQGIVLIPGRGAQNGLRDLYL